MLISEISIGFWNIGGANNLEDPDFIKLISEHHIVVLGETFSNDDSIHVDGFLAKNVFRKKKHKKARRNSGGITILTKLEISKFVSPIRVTSEHFIWLKISRALTGYDKDLFCCGAYIPPNGSPYYVSNPEIDLFADLTHDIAEFSNDGFILVTGDLNARIGNKQDLPEIENPNISPEYSPIQPPIVASPRLSMDKTTNSWGRKLIELCHTCNLCLLNGRTLGDSEGRYTYFATNGYSAIDITLVDSEMLKNTQSFSVHDLNEFSHHCKIETLIKCSPFKYEKSNQPLNPLSFDKFIWDPNASPEKLVTALTGKEFTIMAKNIQEKSYPLSLIGTNMFLDDVSEMLKYLHVQSCKLIKVGKKKSKYSKPKNREWFNAECQVLRQRLRRAANFFSRNPNNQARDEYVLALRSYRKIIKKQKKLHRDLKMRKLVESTDSKELWPLISEFRGKKSTPSIPMPQFNAHFTETLTNPPKQVSLETLQYLEPKVHSFLNCDSGGNTFSPGIYSESFLKQMVKSCKNGKSAFLDGTLNEVLKHSIVKISPILAKLFRHIETSGIFPTKWKTSFLVPLHKKGCKSDPDNYRGLAVGSNLAKLYTKCLNERLDKFTESRSLLSPNQFAFRKNFRTTDAGFTLRSLVTHRKIAGNLPLYACFVDFSKAYDSVNRVALAYKLGTFGIKGPMLKLFMNMYNESRYILKSGGEFSFPIDSTVGVKQGCSLSPLLFNLFINDIHEIFDESCAPVNLNNVKISSLSFADDLVVLSETESGLKNSIKALEKYCDKWGLKVNIKKTKILVFNRPLSKKVKQIHCEIDGKRIDIVKSYTYLGIDVTNTGNFQLACKSLYQKSLRALFSLYAAISPKSDVPNSKLLLKLFDCLIKPILLYGAEIWGPHVAQPGNVITKFVNKFYRTLLGVPNHASTAGVHLELGRHPIAVNIYTTMLKYWARLVTLPRSTLVSHCYWSLYNNDSVLSDPWFRTIRNIIYSTGNKKLWDDQVALSSMPFKSLLKSLSPTFKNVKIQYLQFHTDKCGVESRLSIFKKSKETFGISNFISLNTAYYTRSLLAKLRLGVLPLELEKGRRVGLDRDNRFCKICKNNVIEDEAHFIFDCPSFTAIRETYLFKLLNLVPFLSLMNSSAKLNYLYFSEKTPPKALYWAARLLNDLWCARTTLLSLLPKIKKILQ